MIVIHIFEPERSEELKVIIRELAIRCQVSIKEVDNRLRSLAEELKQTGLLLSELPELYKFVELNKDKVKFPLVKRLVKFSQVDLRKPKHIIARSRL